MLLPKQRPGRAYPNLTVWRSKCQRMTAHTSEVFLLYPDYRFCLIPIHECSVASISQLSSPAAVPTPGWVEHLVNLSPLFTVGMLVLWKCRQEECVKVRSLVCVWGVTMVNKGKRSMATKQMFCDDNSFPVHVVLSVRLFWSIAVYGKFHVTALACQIFAGIHAYVTGTSTQ